MLNGVPVQWEDREEARRHFEGGLAMKFLQRHLRRAVSSPLTDVDLSGRNLVDLPDAFAVRPFLNHLSLNASLLGWSGQADASQSR